MSTYRRLIGLPVIALADGTRLGTVRHLIIDSGKAQIVGLALEDGRWWRPSPVLLLRDAVGLGDEVVTVRDRAALVEAPGQPELEPLLLGERPLVGQRVLRVDGSLLGWVTDYAFDPRSGRILSLEVSPDGAGGADDSDGAVAPQLVAYQQVQVLGPDAVVVAQAVRQEPRHAPLPPPPAPASVASAPVASPPEPNRTTETAADAPCEATGAAPAGQPTATTGGDLARLFRERQERFLLGKVAGRPVLGRERNVLVEAGTTVTQEILAKVKEAGKLLELTASVSISRDDQS
ncbi:MAG: PRC-barrel domain-containing protein [Bacillota bacterium]|nr:PRC-barrel domain-containing protein [Bacillota bacterium]